MRPILRYYGGKWLTAQWIISHFPAHRIYIEPFGGAGSVLLQKQRSYAEIYNDIDEEVVNVFKVVRDHGPELKRRLELTPFARTEHETAYIHDDDLIERARRTIVKTFLGFGSDSVWRKSGFRANCNRSGTTPAHDWKNYPGSIDEIIGRLRGVVIENRDAIELIKAHDSEEALFYIDPPYIHKTRSGGERYKNEMTDQDHVHLLRKVAKLKGKVVISGYENGIYNEELKGWRKETKQVLAQYVKSKNNQRTEVIWMNFSQFQRKFDF